MNRFLFFFCKDCIKPVLVFSIAYFALALSFGLIYWEFFRDDILSQSGSICHLHEAFYFSLITQSSLGYGDYHPENGAMLFASIQVFLGIVFSGIFLGYIAWVFTTKGVVIGVVKPFSFLPGQRNLVTTCISKCPFAIFSLELTLYAKDPSKKGCDSPALTKDFKLICQLSSSADPIFPGKKFELVAKLDETSAAVIAESLERTLDFCITFSGVRGDSGEAFSHYSYFTRKKFRCCTSTSGAMRPATKSDCLTCPNHHECNFEPSGLEH